VRREQADYPLGTIKKSRGLKGELLVSLNLTTVEFEKRIRTVWLGDDPDHLQPWDVEYLRLRNNDALLKLKEINSREEADYLKGILVYVSRSDISDNDPNYLIGYSVYDNSDDHYIGEVIDVSTNSLQQCLVVNGSDRELLIPFVGEFVKMINNPDKKIRVYLMDGLNG